MKLTASVNPIKRKNSIYLVIKRKIFVSVTYVLDYFLEKWLKISSSFIALVKKPKY